jgi:predicted porin
VTSNASRFGLKGEEDLGDGLKAIFQVETRVNLAGNETAAGTGAGTLATTAANTMSTQIGVFNGLRNSNVGLKGDFGTAFVGIWDTPYKVAHNPVELFDNTTIATATALMGNYAGGFNLRQNSSIQYWTPSIGGFQVKTAYSTSNTTNDLASPTTLTANQNPKLVSLSAAYDDAMFYAAFGYEKHIDMTGVNASQKGARFVGAFKFEGGQVGLAYETITRELLLGSRNAMELSAKYKFGASNVAGFVTVAGKQGYVVGTNAHQMSLRYGYNMSKRTEAYALYTSIANGASASYGIVDVTNGIVAGNGSRVSGFGVGVVHTF